MMCTYESIPVKNVRAFNYMHAQSHTQRVRGDREGSAAGACWVMNMRTGKRGAWVPVLMHRCLPIRYDRATVSVCD